MSLKARIAGGLADAVRRAPRPLTEPTAVALSGLLFATFERKATLANLARVYPEWPAPRRWRMGLGAYRQMSRALIEFLQTPRYTDAEIVERMVIDGQEALDEAHAAGRGVVALTGHFGNWEWLARRTAMLHPVAVVYKEPKDPELGERMRELRRAGGLKTIDHEDARGALKWLRSGGVLGILMDQEPSRPEDGIVAPFLGRPTLTYVGPFRLARITGAAVVIAFARREGPARYRARFEPFPLSDDPDAARAIAADAAAYNARLEAEIRARPDHWLWMYGRWRRMAKLEAAKP